jgi:site-specific recombinase XerC
VRLREPLRLPRPLEGDGVRALIGSFRTRRDRAIARRMVFSRLRSAEVPGLEVRDVEIGRGWTRVIGKDNKGRRVPADADVASLAKAYLLGERPETSSAALFVVAKGPNRACWPWQAMAMASSAGASLTDAAVTPWWRPLMTCSAGWVAWPRLFLTFANAQANSSACERLGS